MATNTYIALASVVADGTSALMEITSIPQTYTDLRLVVSTRSSDSRSGYQSVSYTFNNITSSVYSGTILYGNGTTADSYRQSGGVIEGHTIMNGSTSGIFVENVLDIMNYSSTSVNKPVLISMSDSGLGAYKQVAVYRENTAISSIQIKEASNLAWVSGSTATLYGIAAEGSAAKATGGTIYTDAEYYYHVFGATGAFVPSQSLTADILAVGGGGAGGNDAGAGGGAGGVIYFNGQSLSATSYTVTVGSGGATSNTLSAGISGNNSSFGSLTSAVGGGGGTTSNGVAGNGGSGGGGGRNTYLTGGSTTQTGTGATAYHGNAGGNGGSGGGYPAGGGGAGGVGGNNNGSLSGAGGVGISTYSEIFSKATGVGHLVNGAYYLAGGGGGGANAGDAQGAGGYGGGGQGGLYNNPGTGTAGLANMGGGGGGGAGGYGITTNAAAGGSGVVIVRYAK